MAEGELKASGGSSDNGPIWGVKSEEQKKKRNYQKQMGLSGKWNLLKYTIIMNSDIYMCFCCTFQIK